MKKILPFALIALAIPATVYAVSKAQQAPRPTMANGSPYQPYTPGVPAQYQEHDPWKHAVADVITQVVPGVLERWLTPSTTPITPAPSTQTDYKLKLNWPTLPSLGGGDTSSSSTLGGMTLIGNLHGASLGF